MIFDNRPNDQTKGQNFSVELRRYRQGAYYLRFNFDDDIDIDHMFLYTYSRYSTRLNNGFCLIVEECYNDGYEGDVKEESSHQSHKVLHTYIFYFAASMPIND